MTAPHPQNLRRQRNPRGQGDRLRDDIVDAATQLLADPAAPPLTLRGVARAAGVAATSVYLHFADVESLRRAVVRQLFDELVLVQEEASADLTDPHERIIVSALSYCEFGLTRPGHYQVMFSDLLPMGEEIPWEQVPGRPAFTRLAEGVAACTGHQPDDPETWRTAGLIWQQLHGTVSLRITRPRFPWPPLSEAVPDAVGRLIAGAATRSAGE